KELFGQLPRVTVTAIVPGVYAHIQLRDAHFQTQGRVLFDGLPDLLRRRVVKAPMSLHPDAMNWDALLEQLLGELVNAISFSRIRRIVIVVKKERLRIHFMGQAKRMFKIILADNSQPWRIPQLPHTVVLLDSLVDHVPLIDASRISPSDRPDMLLHEGKPFFSRAGLAVRMLPHPAGRLRMPHQGVADQFHSIFLSKPSQLVSGAKAKPPRCRL